MMGKVLWVIGAGASYHLGMPLLAHFEAFFTELWTKFPENQRDAEFLQTLPQSLDLLRQNHGKNIEELLSSSSSLSESDKTILKRAIRRGMERRNLGRILKVFGSQGKLSPYSRLLCLMEAGDVVVNFNYDNALETPLCLVGCDFAILNTTELDSAQIRYLSSDEARRRWIPDACIAPLTTRRLEYFPAVAFDESSSLTIGSGNTSIPLIKIHGSVNWSLTGDRITVASPSTHTSGPLLVYPEAGKPELMNPPHSLLIDSANDALSECEAVVIIGYSFPQSDSVGHPFVSRLTSELPAKRVLAVDPFPSDTLRRIVGDDNAMAYPFEEAVQPDTAGRSPLQREVAKRR
jgi:hypothetical protein